MGKWIALAAIVLVVVLGVAGCTRIGVGHVGIEVDLAGSQRGVQDFTIKTGWVAYNPLATSIVEYPTYVQTAVWTKNPNEGSEKNEEITFTTKDSMVVSADFNVSYQLDVAKVPAFYVKFRSDDLGAFTHGYFKNAARNCINAVAGNYAVEQIMGDNAPFLKGAESCLQKDVAEIGVLVQQFGITGAPRPPEAVINNINMKVQAAQIALQKDNEVRQAQAEAAKQVAYAEGDAKSSIARAEGQAKANELISASLTDKVLERTRLDLQWHWVDRWDGKVSSTTLGSSSGTLLSVGPK
jgi:regulator of protease activity HflC (stomatin/prohibitin superfamily)